MTDRPDLPEWQHLQDLAQSDGQIHLRQLFADDPQRFERYAGDVAGLFIDYSKTRITDAVLKGLLALANACGLETRRDAMFRGEPINTTENRSVLHVALRDTRAGKYMIDGADIMPAIQQVKRQMAGFCDRIHGGAHTGFSGQPLDCVVNIGIGGSDLGPAMITEALKPFGVTGRRSFFVSNIDSTHLSDVLRQLDPARTLFVIASKTFTTQETMTNAASARDWFLNNGGKPADIAQHFVAISTNEAAVTDFGIDPANIFRFWDWVGGRYSLWSAIGLSIALQIGWQNFENLLAGAAEMDHHFETAPMAENIPVMLGLIGVWHRSFLNMPAFAVLPYDQHLHRLPAYLQQADMESNGKSVTHTGTTVTYPTGAIVFGEPGTNGQHAFYQLIHQGTDIIPCDFIASAQPHNPLGDHHTKLLANFLAQPEALMLGHTLEQARDDLLQSGLSEAETDRLAPHKVFGGNRPSVSIVMKQLTPRTLGSLIAMYEHRIFTQGVVWGVNSFDQWGVELGKQLARRIAPELTGEQENAHDSSTAGLIDRLKSWRKN